MRNYIKKLIVKNYTINSYYGGFGNNLQQLALGIMYANLYKKNFLPREHKLLNNFSIINNSFSANFLRKYRFDSRLFHYESKNEKFTNNPKKVPSCCCDSICRQLSRYCQIHAINIKHRIHVDFEYKNKLFGIRF